MKRMDGGMFRNLLPTILFPNDSQCPKCGYFDTSRIDVLDLLKERAIRMGKEENVTQARCKCGLDVMVQLPYKE